MRRWLGVLFVLALLAAAALLGAATGRFRAQALSPWQRLGPDLEFRVISVRSANTLSGEVQVVALRTLPSQLHVARGSTLDVSEWRRREKARAVINGGYFDERGKPLGLRIADGEKFGGLHPANWGVFYIRRGKANILHTRDFKERFTSTRLIKQAIQCGPRLVVNGRTTDLKPQTARRTGIGIQRDGRVIIAVSDGVLTFQEWARLWVRSDGLNCIDALNLDGGGSTQISLKTQKKSLELSGAWPVPDVITIK